MSDRQPEQLTLDDALDALGGFDEWDVFDPPADVEEDEGEAAVRGEQTRDRAERPRENDAEGVREVGAGDRTAPDPSKLDEVA